MANVRANRDAFNFGSVTAHSFVINSGERNNDARQDVFRPSFYAPVNPREVMLDFGLPIDDTESTTPEAKVLREILRAGVNDEQTRIVSIYGKAGVGKSCILRAFGDEKLQEKLELKEHFPDGIYFLSLGMDATETTLIHGLVEIIKMCGGEVLGKELKDEENLRVVLQKVKQWMRGKKCLVLLDDCWERNGLGRSKVRELGQMFGNQSESVIVMTTRFIDLARLGSLIRVEERETDSEEAKAILLRHAKFEREEIEDEEEVEAFCKVLKMCGGLPLFLSVVGRGVAELALELECEESGRKEVWRNYWKELQALGQGELFDTENDEYPNLRTTLRLSLQLLSERRGSRIESLSVSKLTFPEMHRALCVFKKQARIPISVCRRLWKVKSDEATFRIGKWFAGVGLADVESGKRGEKHLECIRLHDLVHMFAMECAEDEEGVARWHGELLESYLPQEGGNEEVRKWWEVCKHVEGDGYLSENVCRHLVSSGNVKEAEGLLVSREWSNLRLEVGGLSAWKADFRERLEGSKKEGGSISEEESEGEVEEGLEMVRDAVIDSWGVVHENPRELGYQVFGRLTGCENAVVRRYLSSIENEECKPWLKPTQRCWERSGEGMMIGEFHLGHRARDIALHKKSFTAVIGVDKEVAVLDLKEMKVTARSTERNDDVRKVGISSDGKRVFSWADDGSVRQWDIESGEECKNECIQLCDDEEKSEDDRIIYAAFSPMNDLMVTGSWRGKIKLWDLRSGERVGCTIDASKRMDCIALSPNGRIVAAGMRKGSVLLCDVQKSRPLFVELKGHIRGVSDIAFNADGQLLASCARDKTIRLWNVENKTQLGDPRVQLEKEKGVPRGVAFTEDSEQIFSAHWDGSISVWDVSNGAQVRSWQAHAGVAHCVAVTGDLRSRVAVSVKDGAVRVWDLQSTPKDENEHVSLKARVWCVAASPDGKFFVSGSEDKTLRMWDSSDGRPLGEALCGHEGTVYSVTVSPDSRQMVSGSWDRTMRVWDVGRHAQVGDALRGHTGGVNCVAYSPSGEFVVSGSDDKTVCVWRVIRDCENCGGVDVPASKVIRLTESRANEGLSSRETLHLEKTLRHDREVYSVVVSRDGQRVLSGLANGEVSVWDVKSGRLPRRIDRKQSDNNKQITWIEVSETNEVVTTNARNQELQWRLDNERGLTRILRSETGITQAENKEGSVAHELIEVVCRGRIVQLGCNDQKIATLPDDVSWGAWAYNAQHRLLCVGFHDGRVLFFQVEY